MRVKYSDLVNQNLDGISEVLEELFKQKFNDISLRVDALKLRKLVAEELNNFNETRVELCEEFAKITKYKDESGKQQSTNKVVQGTKEMNIYNIPEKNQAEFNKKLQELLNTNVDLNCPGLSLTRLSKEKIDCSNWSDRFVELFVHDDRESG